MAVCAFLPVLAILAQVGLSDSVEAVRFTGNSAFSGRRLLDVVSARPKTPFDERRLDADLRALEFFYQQNGFRDVRAGRRSARGRRGFVVTFNVVEGTRSRVAGVVFTGNLSYEDERLISLIPARPGRQLTDAMLDQSVHAIRSRYLNTGFPFVEVDAEWRYADTLADLLVTVSEGPSCYLRELRVRGNRTVATRTVQRATEIREGELFSQQRLQDAQRRLYGTKLFQRVLFQVQLPDTGATTEAEPFRAADSVTVRFDVAEQPYRVFSFGGGAETPPLRLLVSAGWEHDNILNRGQQFELGGEYSPSFTGDFRASVDARYRVPYLILTRIDFQTHPFLYWDKADTVLRREYGIETGLARNVAPNLSAGLFNRFRLVADTSRGITNLVAASVTYDSRDDFFDPMRGVYARPIVEAAGGLLGGSNDFNRVAAEAKCFWSPGGGAVVAARAMVGQAFLFGRTERLPYYEGFALGGKTSLRGYADRSLGPDSAGAERYGSAVVNANLELRSPYLFDRIGLVVFADAGEVVNGLAEFSVADVAYAAGAGVRVRTPIGPVRLDWGKRLKDPEPGDRGRFYLGLLHAF